jgi:ferric-dicitrate binding protein FerR (iron transport regulator)
MNKELLNKYLNGKCSQNEFEEFSKWVNDNSLQEEGKNLLFDDWNSLESSDESIDNVKYSRLLDKIHHQINLEKQEAGKTKIVSFSGFTKWFSRVAAILILPLIATVFYLMSDNDIRLQNTTGSLVDTLEVIAPIGSRTVVQLTDGTTVNLNYGSRIKYPREFKGNSREIELVGEGYFDVAHNPDKPFVVNAGKVNVRVLGTKFNVQAYPGENSVATTLINGKVSLEVLNDDGKANCIGSMKPGQHVAYNTQSGDIYSTVGDVEKYIAWKDGKLVFDNEPITGVAKKLSRMFNVDIILDEDVKDLTYTVTFIDEPLFFILDLMAGVTPIKYSASDREKLSNGTYSKQKIKIERK